MQKDTADIPSGVVLFLFIFVLNQCSLYSFEGANTETFLTLP